MNYSTSPLANIDTLNSHQGFYIVVAILLVVLLITFLTEDIDIREMIPMTIISAVVIVISAAISWNTGKIVVYKNEPVVARMYDNSVETLAYNERVNKRDVVRYKTSAFVYYEVPEGIVSFKRGDGQVWPKTATLYRN